MCLHQEVLERILEVTLRDLGGTLIDEVSGSIAGYDHHLDSMERGTERENAREKQLLE